ncbi:histidine phosphatase family protein [Parvularcula flava]|uniref:Histidine phosphatase family protein n=1 Tax=Aquisalinus luteolus TaxID=1566827 RepID=A0A8J3A796_9PROT|nr:histidine phosphatase family protein [Aquisalinus luteolus]NHK27636.1 histidine phosphatase family protein [Aquisalinus luteolus]GGH96041.1 phosphoglycerate mutase [Aquisalinus luteolus]
MTLSTGRRRLYLMRHGHVDYFQPGLTDFATVQLTDEGRAQAEAAGEALHGVKFDHIFHSGLPRTRQTSELVVAANEYRAGIQPVEATGFKELRGGVYRTDSREELAARLAFSFDEATEPEAEFLPGGERFADAYERIVAGFESLVLEQDWKTALLVAHEGVNRLLLGYASGAGLAGIAHFEQDLACINVLDIDVIPEGEGRVIRRILIKALNITPYDYVKSGLPRTSLEHLFDIDFGGSRPWASE